MGSLYGENCPGCGRPGEIRENAHPNPNFACGYAISKMCTTPQTRCRVDFFHAKPPEHEIPDD